MPNFVAIGQTVVTISRFWIFQDGGSHNIVFLKIYIFKDPNSQEGRTASLCQILSKSLRSRRRCQFSIFQDGGRRHLGFLKFQIFNGPLVKRVELHQRAKFRQNHSNSGWDITIFRFFQDGGRPPSWICNACRDYPRRAFSGLYHCAKFVWNRYSSFDNMQVFRFREFGLKTPIHAPKLGFLGVWPPKWGAM